ncbi:transcriptional regulator [Rhodovulum sulfidophilum]|uniref:Cupin domain-containing protein n=1 Tax=Rhodovulum visakhapatnamense TaxID=364297 RepID=A0ABS1RG44_9RHOB|nr:ChrR family anti-sigma-E factor [Rhodovulum visakhapatnamense]MBL3569554.1 cupin domain-containing protein [Rhodovulum visakhapatnamense]MBL3578220.1 cupin domain-containing protein [Rhodovulum visakhapatnamense]OLS42913.1 transcriptional regulator [Rhodovulum sulfidophilum]
MTTPITHHLTDDILMAHASGSLPEAFGLVVATHVSLCDECRARLAGYEAVGGAVLEDADPAVAMAEDSLAATLRLIAAMPEDDRVDAPAPAEGGVFPMPLRDYVGGDADAVQWRALGGGVRQAVLPTARDATVRLLYIPAGMAMPDHGHGGMELTLVLQGAFEDAGGRYGRGDVEVAGEDLDHTPVAAPGPDCICLAATDAPLKFHGLLPRLAQPFIGI